MNMLTPVYLHYAGLLTALANPKRLELVRVLSDKCSTVSDLITMTGMTQANISQHMQVLRRAGVVITRRQGKARVYCLSHQNFIRILENVHEVLADRKKVTPLKNHQRIPVPPSLVDPVCGMSISPKYAVFAHEYRRTTFYFCASGCQRAFIKNPRRYAGAG